MNTNKILVTFLLIVFSFAALSHSNLDRFDFLIGTWQIENKQKYEEWTKDTTGQFSGIVYTLKDDKKVIQETISLFIKGENTIYQPTVLNQNDGQAIDFILNTSTTKGYSFENLEHDFPQKIQYDLINDNEIVIHVLGADNKGFSYKMIKIQ